MDRSRRNAIIVGLVEKLREHGSWCGETHVQKAAYFMQEMLQVETGFDFMLYKHGPFSFDLRDELSEMQADGYIAMRPQAPPYGPSLVLEAGAERLKRRFSKTLRLHAEKIEFVSTRFNTKEVAELERLATALYATVAALRKASLQQRTERITKLKPHISRELAEEAVKTIDGWEEGAESILGRSE